MDAKDLIIQDLRDEKCRVIAELRKLRDKVSDMEDSVAVGECIAYDRAIRLLERGFIK